MLELEWPATLRLGESDLVRLSVVPYQGGYVVKAEFPEHAVQSQQVTVTRQAGYLLSGVARLDGVGFEISPGGDQEQLLPVDQTATWRWTLKPLAPGQQRLSVMLMLRWTPEAGTGGSPRQVTAFSRGMDVQVSSFLGLSQPQALAAGFVSLLAGLGLGLGMVVLRPPAVRARLQMLAPNPGLAIEPQPRMRLSEEETVLLKGLFNRYSRLALESEFLSGYSGARTFLALPVKADGHADARTIVKIGWREDIQREAENYESFVKDSLPPMTARIQRAPVTTAGSRRAAVQYTFIAEPGRPPISLRQALLETPDPGLLLRLFETFGPGWWMQRHAEPFRLSQEYDRLLPPHYVLRPVERKGYPLRTLSEMTTPYDLDLSSGDVINLGRFYKVEPRLDGVSFTLVGIPQTGQPALRLRWLNPDPPAWSTAAEVVETRQELLAGFVSGMDLSGLPDPLLRLPGLLNEMLQGTRSIIHGDLNLENVLVGPGGFVWLIDFAHTREGHPLFDFAHLATEIIAHVIAPVSTGAEALASLETGRQPLLAALEQIAGRCLFNAADLGEYRVALFLSCLGALKYPNLDQHQKHLLYLTAAWLGQKI